MKKNSFIDYVIKNRYVIICVSIVLILSFTGIISMLINVLFTVLLIILAIYVGKRIQEDDKYISRIFGKQKYEVEYKVKDEENNK